MNNQTIIIRFAITVSLLCAGIAYDTPLLGQTDESGLNALDKTGVRFGQSIESTWKFGLKVKSNGQSSGITGTFPIPIDWPEQSIEIIEEEKSPNVGRISIKKFGPDARLVVFKISRMASGQEAIVQVRIRVNKKHILSPESVETLMFAKSIPSPLRKFLKASPYIEISDDAVKAAADKIQFDDDLSDWKKVEQIFDWVRQNVKYKFDTQIHSCTWALENGIGDCEELSSLFIAICRIKGIPARAVWIPDHTYPEFYMVDGEGEGHWIPCQVAGTREFGAMTEDKPILQKGDSFKVPKIRKPIRYIQPTLAAADSTGGLEIKWISERVIEEN